MTEKEKDKWMAKLTGGIMGQPLYELNMEMALTIGLDIARQLTIANEIAHARGTNELRASQNLAVAYTEEYFDRILGEPATPAPDALVDAVKDFIKANNAKHIGRLTTDEMEPLESALAAHKEAGG